MRGRQHARDLLLNVTVVLLYVLAEPPVWSSSLLSQQLDVMVNDTMPLVVSCSAAGRPAPTVQWTKDGQAVDPLYFQIEVAQGTFQSYLTNVTSFLYWKGWTIGQLTYMFFFNDESSGFR